MTLDLDKLRLEARNARDGRYPMAGSGRIILALIARIRELEIKLDIANADNKLLHERMNHLRDSMGDSCI